MSIASRLARAEKKADQKFPPPLPPMPGPGSAPRPGPAAGHAAAASGAAAAGPAPALAVAGHAPRRGRAETALRPRQGRALAEPPRGGPDALRLVAAGRLGRAVRTLAGHQRRRRRRRPEADAPHM